MEPLFMPFYMRRKKVNPTDGDVRVDFTDQNGDTWQEYPVLHPKFEDWMNTTWDFNKITGDHTTKENLQIAFENSPWYKSTANDIDWIKRVQIQSIIQKYITHSISSTINLPENVTEEEVSKIYLESWKRNLKGITVYRDGSRSGVLVSMDKTNESKFEYRDAPKRPEKLPVEIHTTISKGIKWNVFVGLFDNKPYEVFAIPYFINEDSMELLKRKRGRYDLIQNNKLICANITSEMNDEQEVITRMISTALRHGTDIKFIVEQLNKSHGDITSFSKAIGRVLKKYISEGAKSTLKCEDCGSENVIFEEGCSKCLDCNSSRCG